MAFFSLVIQYLASVYLSTLHQASSWQHQALIDKDRGWPQPTPQPIDRNRSDQTRPDQTRPDHTGAIASACTSPHAHFHTFTLEALTNATKQSYHFNNCILCRDAHLSFSLFAGSKVFLIMSVVQRSAAISIVVWIDSSRLPVYTHPYISNTSFQTPHVPCYPCPQYPKSLAAINSLAHVESFDT